MFVGLGVIAVFVGEIIVVGTGLLVAGGVFVDNDVGTGVRLGSDAPGVRKTSIHAGCVSMEGSRGSRNSLGCFVKKSLFGSIWEPILVFILQVGEKWIAHCPARMTHRNPIKRMLRMMIQSRRFRSRGFSCPVILLFAHPSAGG